MGAYSQANRSRFAMAYVVGIAALVAFAGIAYFVWPQGQISTPTAASFDSDVIAAEIHELVNNEREVRNLQSVEYDATLERASAQFAQTMIDDDFFDHVAPDGMTVNSIASDMGFRCVQAPYRAVADNLAQGGIYYGQYSEHAIASQTVSAWMNSDGHRTNILTPSHDEMGVGVAFDNDVGYIVLSFC